MQDMTPPGDRSIRNIPVPVNHRRAAREPEPEQYLEPSHPRRHRWFWLSALVVVAVFAVGGLLLSTLFAGASVTMYPRQAAVALSQQKVQAHYNAPVGTLSYQTVTLSQAASTTVPAAGQAQVSIPASGKATIFNAYSTANQRLITNTRFTAPDGKIYRIHSSVVVPGAVKNKDGSLAPGSVTATLFADVAGESYNRGSTTFTIPGFQGSPQYSKFYAQTATLGGGFVGMQPSVSASDLASAKSLLQSQLDQSVRAQITAQIPQGFVVLPGTVQIVFDMPTQGSGGGTNAIVSQTATAVAAAVRASDLAGVVAKALVAGYTNAPVDFADLSQLVIVATSSSPTALQNAVTAKGPITLLLSGSPIIVWQFDSAALKAALLGKDKGQFETIVKTFEPAITRADAKIRPFWQSAFPQDPNKIFVTIDSGAGTH